MLWVVVMEVRLSCDEDIGFCLLILSLRRVVILWNYLELGNIFFLYFLEIFVVLVEIVLKFLGGLGILIVVDNRIGKKYEFEISEGGILKVMDF